MSGETTPHFHSEKCYAVGPGDTEVLVCGFGGHAKPEVGPMRDTESPSGVQTLGSSGPPKSEPTPKRHKLTCASRLIWNSDINKRTGERKKNRPPLPCDCGFVDAQEESEPTPAPEVARLIERAQAWLTAFRDPDGEWWMDDGAKLFTEVTKALSSTASQLAAAHQERDKFKHAWEDISRVCQEHIDARGLLEQRAEQAEARDLETHETLARLLQQHAETCAARDTLKESVAAVAERLEFCEPPAWATEAETKLASIAHECAKELRSALSPTPATEPKA